MSKHSAKMQNSGPAMKSGALQFNPFVAANHPTDPFRLDTVGRHTPEPAAPSKPLVSTLDDDALPPLDFLEHDHHHDWSAPESDPIADLLLSLSRDSDRRASPFDLDIPAIERGSDQAADVLLDLFGTWPRSDDDAASDAPVLDFDGALGRSTSGGGKGKQKPIVDSGTTSPTPTSPTTTTPTTTTTTVAIDYTSGKDTPGGFNIDLIFSGTGWTDALKLGFQTSAEYLSDIITGDLPSVTTSTGVIDDIRISVSLTTLDGTGGLGGWGGYTSLRSDSLLPSQGYVKMDSADASYWLSKGLWDDFAVHEMLHSLGFGTAWKTMGLVTDYAGDLRFTGDAATKAYNDLYPLLAGPDPRSDLGVPVETDGGSGTAGVHWDDSTFKNEIMTGTLNWSNTVSDMTLAALEDMGYQTLWPDYLIA